MCAPACVGCVWVVCVWGGEGGGCLLLLRSHCESLHIRHRSHRATRLVLPPGPLCLVDGRLFRQQTKKSCSIPYVCAGETF